MASGIPRFISRQLPEPGFQQVTRSKMLVEKTDCRTSLRRQRYRWDDNTKTDLTRTQREDVQ
jgi:hypothetical protein